MILGLLCIKNDLPLLEVVYRQSKVWWPDAGVTSSVQASKLNGPLICVGHRNSAHLFGSSLKCTPVWLLAVGSCVFRYSGLISPCILTKALALPWALCCLCCENKWAPNPFPGSWLPQSCLLNFSSQSHGSTWRYTSAIQGCSQGMCC